MNINDYRKAMGHIIPDAELKERIMSRKSAQKQYVPVRRALACALAAVLTLACLFTAALAASPELRTAVLSFFRVEEPEHLPDNSQDMVSGQPDISQAEIGGLIKAQYVKLDHYYGSSGDLLTDMTWSEDRRTLLEAKFWEIRDNEMVPVQIDMQTNQIDVTFQGIRYQGELYWFIRNEELYVFQGIPYGVDTRPEDLWHPAEVPGRTDVLMLRLAQGRQLDYTEYPVLYHLDTGEVEDILEGTGVVNLEYAYDYSWSENMRKVIILTGNGNGPDYQGSWFCDLDAGTLIPLDNLLGIGACTAAFADNDTLAIHHLFQDEEQELRDVEVYAYDIPSGRVTKTLERTPYYQYWNADAGGVEISGSHCVLISPDGQVRTVDLKTGAQTLLEGFTFHQNDRIMFSPSGSKLLYFSMNPGSEGLGITQLGLADLDKGVFTAFDRDGHENLYEEGIGWSGDNTVSINARTTDGEARYLITYTF